MSEFPEVQGAVLERMEEARNYNRWLFARCEPYMGRRVLDAGAGIGTFTELAAPGREVVALEPDPELAPVLRRRMEALQNVTVVEGTAEQVDGEFDSVVCMNVLEHIPDDEAALRRFHDVLRPGGRLLLLVPAHPALYGGIDRAVAHERRYAKVGLREKLVGAGFGVERLRYVNPLGALGWLVSSRLRNREQVPEGPLLLYDRLVPILRQLDRVDVGVGLSLWAVARR
jgi:SAM-dependent methyltransferase